LPDGNVFLKFLGMLSGISTTAEDNSLKTFMDAVAIVKYCIPDSIKLTYDLFMLIVIALVYGDDLVFSILPEYEKYFTADTIGAAGLKIGMLYTFQTDVPISIFELEVLSNTPVLVDWKGIKCWLPRHNCHKALNSMLKKNEKRDLPMLIQRLCGLRIQSWPCPECRKIFAGFKEYLDRVVSSHEAGVSTAWRAWLTDDQLAALYMGTESNGITHQQLVALRSVPNLPFPFSFFLETAIPNNFGGSPPEVLETGTLVSRYHMSLQPESSETRRLETEIVPPSRRRPRPTTGVGAEHLHERNLQFSSPIEGESGWRHAAEHRGAQHLLVNNQDRSFEETAP